MKEKEKSTKKEVYIIMDLGNDEPEVWAICSTRAIAEMVLANYEKERFNDGQAFFEDEWEIETATLVSEMPKEEKLTKRGQKEYNEFHDIDEEGGDDE